MKILGITREEEERYLADTIEAAQKNLDHAEEEVKRLTEESENAMQEANRLKEEALLTLWNNTRSLLDNAKNWLIRANKARKKPYFGRIDFSDATSHKQESYYVGRVGILRTPTEPAVIDWRTPVASLYYENGLGRGRVEVADGETYEIDLQRKRTYEIEKDQLKDFYDMDVVSNDELLTKYLSKNKSQVLGEIIATIQKEQNRIIRRSPKTNVIVQGVAGSGKTTVAMHRISYLLFNYEEEIRPEDFYIVGSNEVLLNYITGVLPELDVYGVRQMTMEELFIRLLYEDWEPGKYSVHRTGTYKGDDIKGTDGWFLDLQEFCRVYELTQIPCEDIYMEASDEVLLSGERIRSYIRENPAVSMQSKRLFLNEMLYAQYENLCMGRYSTLTEEEKKELEKGYHTYFARWGKYGKADWEGSVYELYREFIEAQKQRGYEINLQEDSLDVYDLAALAYLYKRIKETDPVREASHVVIDEAQDFGMMAYQCLHYCLRGCTYTIMGDTSQNIHYPYGLNDWSNLRKLILRGPKDDFLLLRKSYRNTVEISDFATQILFHGDFAVYPVEPVIRHGSEVQVCPCEDMDDLTAQAVTRITFWQMKGYETIAVICRDEKEAAEVIRELAGRLDIKDMETDASFGSGVMILPVAATKGLEFDAVLIWNPASETYPADNGHVKMLYVAATRALHELAVLHTGNLTELIAKKADPERKQQEFELPEAGKMPEEGKKRESALSRLQRQKQDAGREMKERSYIGPERIQAAPVQKNGDKIKLPQKEAAQKSQLKEESQKSQMRKQPAEKLTDRKVPQNPSIFKYGELPKDAALAAAGHTKANTAVRWVKKNKNSLEVTSAYGTLLIIPVSEECIRIRFAKGMTAPDEGSYWVQKTEKGLKWTARESSTTIETATKKITVRIDKRDGALQFLTADRKMLLRERSSDCRLIDKNRCWEFFDFDRSEKLKARGVVKDEFMDLTNKARYISFGGRGLRMPLVLSNKGYALAVAGEGTTLFCGIKSYGPYIYTDAMEQIDYFFLYGGSQEKNQCIYEELSRQVR